MKVEVQYVQIVDGDDAATETKAATYTQLNINVWDVEDAPSPVLILHSIKLVPISRISRR